jgi:hypothetical protein
MLVFYVFKHQEITPTELAIQTVVMAIIASVSSCIVYHQNTDDEETLNGHVTGKHMEEVPCEHSYSCDPYQVCHSKPKGGVSCTTHWHTCWEHHRGWRRIQGTDFSWFLDTTLGKIYINRVDRRGVNEPPRYTKAAVLDPVSVVRTYENYIKAAPGTLLKHQGLTKKYAGKLPGYPQRIYDYHYMDRIVTLGGVSLGNPGYWNRELARLNDRVAKRQANVILVLAEGYPQEYAYALEQHWVGGKKNDVVVILGTQSNTIKWTYVMTWSKNELYKVQLRNDLNELGNTLDMHKVLGIIENDTAKMFVRRPMHDFEYLKASITPTPAQWAWSMIIGVLVSIGLSFFFSHPDVHISIAGKPKKGHKYPYEY